MDGLRHLLGADAGSFYNFYSGFAQAVGSVTLLGGLVTFWRHKKYHVSGCYRLGKMGLPDSSWILCHRHHPEGHATTEKITRHHEARMKAKQAS